MCYIELSTPSHWRRLFDLAKVHGVVPEVLVDNYEQAVGIGKIHLHVSDYKHAIEYFKRALAFSPDDERARYFLGYVYFLSGETHKSLKHFEELIQKNTSIADVYYQAGQCYSLIGNDVKAQDLFSQTTKMLPQHLEAWLMLQKGSQNSQKIKEVDYQASSYSPKRMGK